ncbi:MAG TPA: patatin-like phospholipase family protein [Noviherbaspirillum sp.]|uniref:patatin-like phospholipase family protein n=1 Tax=Noviherbaspirillum sp. TaxID=1926288 RepID=UPI002B481F88|nr:patatin-like phospholipase family protein [Noviherbaspirillum sp.]HJV87544.1 patatin-like phospholipase family protein [Noviherbaspirillum sp.]
MANDNKRGRNNRIMLALQGGGAHTAYVWGVVDRLLQEERLDIVAVSGTSGGAMIAAVLAYGLSMERDAQGHPLDVAARRAKTRELLDKFWTDVAALGNLFWNPYRFTANPLHTSWNIDGLPVPVTLNALSLVISPYQSLFGPRQNPVAMAIGDSIDLEVLNHSPIGPALYVCATNVRTSQPKSFTKEEIGIPHLLASACLPVVDRAVLIDGEYYWDGGYVADPALAPLITHHKQATRDLVIVGVNPIVMQESEVPPDTAWEIIDRMNEITFNASLIAEIKRIHEVNELLRQVPAQALAKQPGGKLHGKEEIFMHYIPPHAEMAGYGVASKSNTALSFLQHMKALGREVADAWLAGRIDGGGASLLSKSSDSNLDELFINPHRPGAPALPHMVQGVQTVQTARGTAAVMTQ